MYRCRKGRDCEDCLGQRIHKDGIATFPWDGHLFPRETGSAKGLEFVMGNTEQEEREPVISS